MPSNDNSHPVWVPDDKTLFTKAQIVGEDHGQLKVRVLETNQTITVESKDVENVNPTQFDLAPDIAELTYLNEPSVVHNLYTRWKNGMIYTYSGLFLVAVNPYKSLDIYTKDIIEQYKTKKKDEIGPHIFAVSQEAYRSMIHTNRDQSILITGESGAGKTENTKKVIQFLSNVSKNGINGIDERIWQTNPILEAFGNAMTIRNTNSSRFGKFVKIQFSLATQDIVGASIEWYLLEKSRVVTQHSDERNYHVFYQLLAGANNDLKQKLFLNDINSPSDFEYLKSSASKIEGVDDKKLYSVLEEAFRIMGFSTLEFEHVMTVVALILWLGQIVYRASNADQGSIMDNGAVPKVCQLLGVSEKQFVDAMLHPNVKAGKETMKQSRTASQAKVSTNALAKALYEKLFGYIVEHINQLLGSVQNGATCIGVLDIAGFEIFDKNSFEQLCINYTNEKLQQFFNHHMFVLEQEEYVKEKVEWEYKDYGSDLQPTIALIEQSHNPMGILSSLDEESVLPTGSEIAFNEKLAKLWGRSNPKFTPSRLGTGFTIDHYAQTVHYDTTNWIEKNKDPLSDSIVQLLNGSSNDLIKIMFPKNSNEPMGIVKKSKSAIFRTVAQRHKHQLNELVTHLSLTQPHFVRCILPNTTRSPNEFSNKLVLDQLRYNGVLEGIRIARTGFPNRLEFKEFEQRYLPLVGSVGVSLGTAQCSSLLLEKMKLDPKDYKVGLSKVFFRSGVLANLEHKIESLVIEVAKQVQDIARGFIARKRFQKLLNKKIAAKKIAKSFRDYQHMNKEYVWFDFIQNFRQMLDAANKAGSNSTKLSDARIRKMEATIQKFEKKELEMHSEISKVRGSLTESLQSNEQLQENLRRQNQEHEHSLTLAKARDEASSNALQSLASKHTALNNSKLQLESEVVELKNKCLRLEQGLEKAKSDVKDMTETASTCKKLKEELDQKVNELNTLNSELTKVKGEHSSQQRQLQTEHEQSLTKIRSEMAKEHQQTIDSLKMEVETQKSELALQTKTHTENMAKAERSLFDAQAHKDAITKRFTELEAKSSLELQKKEEEFKKAKTEFESTKTSLESALTDNKKNAYEASKLRQDLLNAEKQLKTANERIHSLTTDLKVSRMEYAKLKDEFVAAKNMLRNDENSHKRMASELKEAKKKALRADSSSEVEELRDVKEKLLRDLRLANQRNDELNKTLKSRHFDEKNVDTLKQTLREKSSLIDTLTAQVAAASALQSEYVAMKKNSDELRHRNHDLLKANAQYMLEEKTRPKHADVLETQRVQEQIIRDLRAELQDYKVNFFNSEKEREKLRIMLNTGVNAPTRDKRPPKKEQTKDSVREQMRDSVRDRDDVRFNQLVDLQLEKELQQRKSKSVNDKMKFNTLHEDSEMKPLHMISNNRRISESTHVESVNAKNFELEESLNIHKERLKYLMSKNDQACIHITKLAESEKSLKAETEELQRKVVSLEELHEETSRRHDRVVKGLKDQLYQKSMACNNLAAKLDVNVDYENKVNSLSATLAEISDERDRLSNDKSRLEKRLLNITSSDSAATELLDNLAAMGIKEKELLSENEDLRGRMVAQDKEISNIHSKLVKAESSLTSVNEKLELLQSNFDKQTTELQSEKRQVSEYRNMYLIAERELAPYRRQTESHSNRPHATEPAFI